jgi:hypothetical protein
VWSRSNPHTPLLGALLDHAQQRQVVFEGFGQRDDWSMESLQQGLQAPMALRQRRQAEIPAA